jgi:hypothetical protein
VARLRRADFLIRVHRRSSAVPLAYLCPSAFICGSV